MENKKNKSYKFFITTNNWTQADWEYSCEAIEECTYGLTCKEVGKEGTPHLHTWLHFKNERSWKAIQKKFPKSNVQIGMGSDADQKYLKKDGDFVEFGSISKQGCRTDLDKIKNIVKNGGGMNSIIDVSSNYQAMKMGELLLKYREKKRPIEPIEVIWYYGKSGTGKTKAVFDAEVDIFRPTSYKWWEGYDGDNVVLIDEWRPTFCSFQNLLKITDIYPFKVQCKGGSREVKYKKIYFTSDKSPEHYFCVELEMSQGEYLQLKRRITTIKCFDA